ncbi:N-acetylmuramoyl-L-alanine amidase [Nocardioides litoris]|uniref:N-acetylmuramoyl-L-alanine amidase n=1 Tax=Nocardioides litoris TaxID=1926648 RepID=UPI00111D4C7E|nr:N-acetylmuramoyl-L-alanine amidase [Nocardioides litoris]
MSISGTRTLRRTTAPAALVVVAALVWPTTTGGPAASADERPGPAAGRAPTTARMAPAGPGLRAADVPLARGQETVEAPPFAMVGLTWRGGPRPVKVSTRTDGRWSAWRDLGLLHDGPDAATSERRRAVTGTDLAWVGRADAVRVDVAGPRPDALTLVLLDPSGAPTTPPAARKDTPGTSARKPARFKPRLRSRASWGAPRAWRTGRPTYNRTVQQVHVHHTVNSNSYGKDDVPGLLRGIYRYHTQSLGWSDIGYNFLVDRFGRTWVGRAGGAKKAVRGAHTLGFNSTSTGVAVIGNFETATPSSRVIGALAKLSAWKLRAHGRKPQGRVRVWSHGSDRYPAGRTVTLPTIDGHRDTSQTACPGRRLYTRLPDVRRRAATWIAKHR